MNVEVLKNFIENFDNDDIFDLIIFSKFVNSNNFYIIIKHIKFDYMNLRKYSKSKSLFSPDEIINTGNININNELNKFDYNVIGDLNIFNSKKNFTLILPTYQNAQVHRV